MKLIYGVLGIAIIFLAFIIEGGHPRSFLHHTSFVLILGPTLLLTLMHHSPDQLGAALKAAFGSGPLTCAEATRHTAVIATPRRIVIGLGFVGFGAGMLQTFHHLDDPSKVGAGIALSLISITYSLILAEFLLAPMVNRIWSRVEDEDPPDTDSKEPSPKDRPRGIQLAFGVAGFLLLASCLAMDGTHLYEYAQGTVFIMVVGPTIFLTLAHHSMASIIATFRAAFSEEPCSMNKVPQYLSVLSTARIITLAAGAVGLIFNLVHSFQNLSDPSKVGDGMALSALAPFYAVIISEFFFAPLSHRIKRRAGVTSLAQDTAAKPNAGIIMLGTLGAIYFFPWVLYVTASPCPPTP